MKMQDKEFDGLFGSKLGDIEMEPSANVWAGIDAELNAGSRKRKYLSVLSIAASIIVLITAGLLFIPKKQGGNIIKRGKNNMAHNQALPPAIKPAVAVPADDTSAIKPQYAAQANNMAVARQPQKIKLTVKPAEQTVAAVAQKPQDVLPDNQAVLAVVPQKPDETVKPVVPDVTTPLIIKQSAIMGADAAEQPVLASAQPMETGQAEPVAKKHKVRNFGDLFNIVIAKVDKRKDKFIVFSDSDDDESTVSAVNIGPIKIKK